MGQLSKASELMLPAVAGEVKLPLAELDKLRAEAISAIKLAQDLEAKQKKIQIELWESKFVSITEELSITDRNGKAISGKFKNFTNNRQKTHRLIEVDFVNMEDVVPAIIDQERMRVEQELQAKDEEITKEVRSREAYQNELTITKAKYDNEVSKLRKEYNNLFIEKGELEKQLLHKKETQEKYDTVISGFSDKYKELQEENERLRSENDRRGSEILKLRSQKSLWWYLWGNDKKI